MSKSKAEAQFQFIPVTNLTISPLNVRQTGKEAGIEQLAQLILAEGVLQNLSVHLLKNTQDGAYGVIAGGRRLQAMQQLVRQKKLKADYPVPCMIVNVERAVQISLAENSGREVMHPADEFEAFKQLIDAGQPIEDVAARFGVSTIVVQRRLKLADVSPKLFAAYRDDKLSLETLMAFAVSNDHEQQEQIYATSHGWQLRPDTVRDRLTQGEVTLKDPIARYVGLKAYEKAGGTVRRDLFAEDNDALLNAALIKKLALEKLEKQASKLKSDGVPWVEIHPKLDYETRARFAHVKTTYRKPAPDEQSSIDALEKQIDELQQLQDNSDDEAAGEGADQAWDKANDELDQLRESLAVVDPAQQALAGAVISVGHDGKIEIERDMLKSEDALRFQRARKLNGHASADGALSNHSAALTRRLTAQRTLALQAEVARKPAVALVALVHKLLQGSIYLTTYGESPVGVHTSTSTIRQHAEELQGTRAQISLSEHRTRIMALLPKDPTELFSWLSRQANEILMDLLAYCVSETLDGVRSDEGDGVLEPLAKLAQLDMRCWWEPTAANYFESLPKSRILAVVTEAKSEAAAAPLGKLKKGALALEAEKQLADTRWLPSIMGSVA